LGLVDDVPGQQALAVRALLHGPGQWAHHRVDQRPAPRWISRDGREALDPGAALPAPGRKAVEREETEHQGYIGLAGELERLVEIVHHRAAEPHRDAMRVEGHTIAP